MSFYRSAILALAAFGLASSVFAADVTTENSAPQSMEVATADTTDTTMSATTEDKVNINTATTKQLMHVKGLSAAKAKAIVSYRKKHGDFKSTDDLKMVKGFKKMKEDKMKMLTDQMTVG